MDTEGSDIPGVLRPGTCHVSPAPSLTMCERGGQDQRVGDRGQGGLAADGSPRVLLGVLAQDPRKAGRGHQGEKRCVGGGGRGRRAWGRFPRMTSTFRDF